MKLNRKNKLLLLGFIIVLYFSYAFAISNTITYYKEYQSKSEMVNSNNITPKSINQLLQRENQLDKLLVQYNVTASESYQNDLLKQLTLYSEEFSLKIIDFKEPHTISNNNTDTSSYVFSLQGSFNGCLLLINEIENNPKLGSIKHINFIKKRNYKSNIDELTVEVVLQKVKSE